MLFGDPGDFAIEADVEPRLESLPPSGAACSLLFARAVPAQDFANGNSPCTPAHCEFLLYHAPLEGQACEVFEELLPTRRSFCTCLPAPRRRMEGARPLPRNPKNRNGIIQVQLALDGNEYIIDFPLPPPDGSRIYRFQSVRGPARQTSPLLRISTSGRPRTWRSAQGFQVTRGAKGGAQGTFVLSSRQGGSSGQRGRLTSLMASPVKSATSTGRDRAFGS